MYVLQSKDGQNYICLIMVMLHVLIRLEEFTYNTGCTNKRTLNGGQIEENKIKKISAHSSSVYTI